MSEKINAKKLIEKYNTLEDGLKALALQPQSGGFNEKLDNAFQKVRIAIGIDTGTQTGVAVWDAQDQRFEFIKSTFIHTAIEIVFNQKMKATLKGEKIFVRIEDARKYYMTGKSKDVHKGVGSICRDAKIWEDFLTDYNIPFELVAPFHNNTKLTQKQFKQRTGWAAVTNEHKRDAGMLVYGFSVNQIKHSIKKFGGKN